MSECVNWYKVFGEKIEAENGVAQAMKLLHSATLR